MSYVDFDYYQNIFEGQCDENTFLSLYKAATSLVLQFMELYIAPWELKESIEDYPCDMKEAICYQIDYLKSFGGLDTIKSSGPTDFDIKTIKTEGFEYSYDSDVLKERIQYFNGIPFSKMTIRLIKKQLRLYGLMCRQA